MDAALELLVDFNRQLFCRRHRPMEEGEARHGNRKGANCWLVRACNGSGFQGSMPCVVRCRYLWRDVGWRKGWYRWLK